MAFAVTAMLTSLVGFKLPNASAAQPSAGSARASAAASETGLDRSAFDALLKAHVKAGKVDYDWSLNSVAVEPRGTR